jgi:hypothetical protein
MKRCANSLLGNHSNTRKKCWIVPKNRSKTTSLWKFQENYIFSLMQYEVAFYRVQSDFHVSEYLTFSVDENFNTLLRKSPFSPKRRSVIWHINSCLLWSVHSSPWLPPAFLEGEVTFVSRRGWIQLLA